MLSPADDMSIGDVVLLHVGAQDRRYESGVYAFGKVVNGPYILRDHPQDYCIGKNTVDVEIVKIVRGKPLITHEECKQYIRQFRTVHRIDGIWYDEIQKKLLLSLYFHYFGL